jgi:hypothetical protein
VIQLRALDANRGPDLREFTVFVIPPPGLAEGYTLHAGAHSEFSHSCRGNETGGLCLRLADILHGAGSTR